MKKIKYLLLVVFAAILVTGCNNNKTLKCTVEKELGTIKYTAVYEIEYTSDEIVKSVVTTEKLISEDSDYLAESKTAAEDLYGSYDNAYGGYKYNVSINGDTLTSKCTVDYTKMNVKKYVEDNPSLTNFADENNNVKLSGVKSIYSQLGAKCEE